MSTDSRILLLHHKRLDFLKRHFKSAIFRTSTIIEIGGLSIHQNRHAFGVDERNIHTILPQTGSQTTSLLSILNASLTHTSESLILVHWNVSVQDTIMNQHCLSTFKYCILQYQQHDGSTGVDELANHHILDLVSLLESQNFNVQQLVATEPLESTVIVAWKGATPIRERRDRIALYFAGRVKTYEDQLDELRRLQDEYDIDCFCSINGERDEFHEQFIHDMHIVRTFFENHETKYDRSWERTFHRLPTQNDRDAYKLSSSLYNNKKCIELIEEYQKQHNFVYDIVIKYRADIISQEMLPIPEWIVQDRMYIPEGHDWHFYNQLGINDHIAFASFDLMKIYSDVFSSVATYCGQEHRHGYHPESLLWYHLQQNNVKVIRFPFTYGHNTNRHEPGEYG